MSEYTRIYRKFSFLPHNEELYRMAFTHSSYNGMVGSKHEDYERLEFLGDSIIGMVVSELCYRHHPNMDQGKLSILKAQFIRSESEADYCRRLDLVQYIRLGTSFKGSADNSTSILEDVFESFIGALFLDQGLGFTRSFLIELLEEDVKNAKIEVGSNPKNDLQQAMQSNYKKSVEYKILKEEGPGNDKWFTVGVYFEGMEIGQGMGKNKKEAEVAAAKDALSKRADLTEFGNNKGD